MNEWEIEKRARDLSRENRRRIAAGEAYCNEKISVKYDEGWHECGHEGCSGADTVTITATNGDKEVSVTRGGCFGFPMNKLIEELLEAWDNHE